MSNQRAAATIAKFFWISMMAALIVGIVALVSAVLWQAQGHQSISQEVIDDIAKAHPDLRVVTAENMKAIMVRWEKRINSEMIGAVIVRDFAIAILIAVFVTVSIELYAGNKLRSQISEDVIEAVYRTVVPKKIYDQIADSVFRASAIKKDWKIQMTLSRNAQLSPNGELYQSRTITSYKLQGLLGRTQPNFPVGAGLDLDLSNSELDLPRFTKIKVGDKIYEKNDLKQVVDDRHIFKSSTVLAEFSSTNPVQIVIEIEEIVRVPDMFVWSTNTITDGIEISIDTTNTPEIEFTLVPLHPKRNGLVPIVEGMRWIFTDGMLPWQGIEVCSKLKDMSPPTS